MTPLTREGVGVTAPDLVRAELTLWCVNRHEWTSPGAWSVSRYQAYPDVKVCPVCGKPRHACHALWRAAA
jgi:hypothetical protein